MSQSVITAVSATIAGCSMLVALVGLIASFWRNSKKESGESAAYLAEMKADIKCILSSVNDLKNNQERFEKRLSTLEDKVAHIEERVEVSSGR